MLYCLLVWGGGKKTAWKVWDPFPAVTDVFYALANPPVDVTDYVMAPLQRFVITSMTRPVTPVTSMRHGSIYFAKKHGTLKTSLQPKQRPFSIHYEPCTRPVTSGARRLCHLRYYQTHRSWNGSRRMGCGSQTGCYFRR